MTLAFLPPETPAIPLIAVAPETLDPVLSALPPPQEAWARRARFRGKGGETLVLPAADGGIDTALVGTGSAGEQARGRFLVAQAVGRLPAGSYRLEGLAGEALEEAALGWLLASYRFDRYRKPEESPTARLVAPEGVDAARIERVASAEALTRDLINTAPADMGPADLAGAAQALAERHGARVTVTGGEALARDFPLIHAVGRAAISARAPRLIDMHWGDAGPLLTLVGKGVCFDTGGLDIKPASSMGLMKKDMGGAAAVLGLAAMVMGEGLPLRLRVLIPAVENAVGPDSFRPQDVLTSRKGLTVEVNNTDAEGRLVLADALALAGEGDAGLTLSMATLTGAARVAVGPDLAPFYASDDADAAALMQAAAQVRDPLWRMPFHAPYEEMIEPGIADLDNAPAGGMAGSITAALFLRRFAPPRYIHFDIYGWQPKPAPARPKGGVGQGARAVFAALPALLEL